LKELKEGHVTKFPRRADAVQQDDRRLDESRAEERIVVYGVVRMMMGFSGLLKKQFGKKIASDVQTVALPAFTCGEPHLHLRWRTSSPVDVPDVQRVGY
jgi:hypothetical protein